MMLSTVSSLGVFRFCAVSVERGELRYTLIVDAEWTALAREVSDLDPSSVDGMPLPRRAWSAAKLQKTMRGAGPSSRITTS